MTAAAAAVTAATADNAAARPGRCSGSSSARAYRSDSPPSSTDEHAAARITPAEGQRREFTLR